MPAYFALRCVPKRLPSSLVHSRRLQSSSSNPNPSSRHSSSSPSSSNQQPPSSAVHANGVSAGPESASPAPVPVPARYGYEGYGYAYARKALSPVSAGFRAYGRSQRRWPWLTQILTAVGVYSLGDFNAQKLFGNENEDESYDFVRTGRMTLIGAVFAVPWFEWYSRLTVMFSSLPSAAAIACRVAMNQLIITPPFLCCFFALQGALAGLSFSDIVEKVTVAAPRAFQDSCKFWPAMSFINFWLVPFEFRALFGGFVSVGWNCYLSWLNTRADAMVEEDTELADTNVKQAVPAPAVEKKHAVIAVKVEKPPQRVDLNGPPKMVA